MENYDALFDKETASFQGKRKLLLHACCAPCSSSVLERVTPFFDVTAYFYNPNITDEEEYYKRLKELERFCSLVYGDGVKIVDGGFSPEVFYSFSKGLEGEPERGGRCTLCYNSRLEKAAFYAAENGFDLFCTTLTLSPHKDAVRINEAGRRYGESYGVKYLFSDFKKKGGYLRSIELSKEYGLYRQNYCGCEFSARAAIKREKVLQKGDN